MLLNSSDRMWDVVELGFLKTGLLQITPRYTGQCLFWLHTAWQIDV